MKAVMKKVNYSEYEGKYDESIKTRMEKAPESVDIETMRANLYGYTFTKEYAEGEIPDELSMDYWEEYHFENNLLDASGYISGMAIINDTNAAFKDGTAKIYRTVSPQEKLILRTIESTGDGESPETAMCVISVHQEYEYIDRVWRYCCMRIVKQSIKNGIDCLVLKDNEGNTELVYFDISRRFDVGYPNQ